MADSFKKVLGASFDVNEGLSDTNGTMLALADAFAGMEDGGRKTALAMELLGKSGADLIPFLNQGSDEIERLTEISAKLRSRPDGRHRCRRRRVQRQSRDPRNGRHGCRNADPLRRCSLRSRI
jgi:hypothetical protein